MDDVVSRPTLLLGLGSAALLVLFEIVYTVVLLFGLSNLDAPGAPISDPYFTAMEVLILLLMPPMIVLAATAHATCVAERKAFSLAALAFVSVLTGVTTSVHASTLVLSRDPAFDGMSHIFSFEWPSVVYVLDVLAWDYFFALFAASLAFSFGRTGREGWARRTLLVSALLAFAGLWGAATGDMRIRNIGIIGYVPVFTIAVVLMGMHFAQCLQQGTLAKKGL